MRMPDKTVAFHARPKLLSFLRAGFAALIFLAAANHSEAADAATYYANWVKPWVERPTTSAALAGTELRAVVSIVTGEADANKIADMTPAERLNLAYHIKVATTEIATNGMAQDYFVSNLATKIGEPRPLSAEERQKLEASLVALPDDHQQLPLAGRRVVVQTLENGQWHVRVYDGKQLPAEVKSLLDQLANPYAAML